MVATIQPIARAVSVRPDRQPGKIADDELGVPQMAHAGIPQTAAVYAVEHREYEAPFNYPNFYVELGREARKKEGGAEYNPDGVEIDVPPFGAITFVEEEPIIGVTVIGSACSPPGTVLIHAEPLEWKYPRTGVKMKASNLWGEHVNGLPWGRGVTEDWREAGLSSAAFDMPPCSKVTVMGWSQLEIGQRDIALGNGHDGHYCVRIIRVTVRRPAGG